MSVTDLSLTEQQVRSAQRGNRAALDDLLARYLPRVRRIVALRIRKHVRELSDIDDLVQDTFKDVLTGLDAFTFRSEGSFCHWLATCIENNIRDAMRKGTAQRRGEGRVRNFADLGESSLADSIFEGGGPTPSQMVRGRETEDRIEQALLGLSERYREVINLRVHCQLSYREITEVMQLPTENTATLLFMRARDKLKKLLES